MNRLESLLNEFSWLINFLVRQKVHQSDAEDVCQEIFLAICQDYRSIAKTDRIGGWIRSVVHNHIVNYYRTKFRVEIRDKDLMSSPWNTGDIYHEPDAWVFDPASAAEILDRLPSKYRTVMALRYLDELTVREIADQLGMSPADISNRLSYAKKILRRHIKRKNKFQEMKSRPTTFTGMVNSNDL